MSRSSKPANKKGVNPAEDVAPFLRKSAEYVGYVNVEQNDASKENFSVFADDAGLVSEVTAEVLLAGYKLSIVQSDDEETVKAVAYAAFAGMPDAGLAVSAWGGNALHALAGVVFIVGIQARHNLSQYFSEPSTKGRRTF